MCCRGSATAASVALLVVLCGAQGAIAQATFSSPTSAPTAAPTVNRTVACAVARGRCRLNSACLRCVDGAGDRRAALACARDNALFLSLVNDCTFDDCPQLGALRDDGAGTTGFGCYLQLLAEHNLTRASAILVLDRTAACRTHSVILNAVRLCDPSAFGTGGWEQLLGNKTSASSDGSDDTTPGTREVVVFVACFVCVLVMVVMFLLWRRQRDLQRKRTLHEIRCQQLEAAAKSAHEAREAHAARRAEIAAALRPEPEDPYVAEVRSGRSTVTSYLSVVGSPTGGGHPGGASSPDDVHTLKVWETNM